MLFAAFAGLMLGAAACFGAGRAVPARRLGLGAALVALASAALALFAPTWPADLAPLTLLAVGEVTLTIGPGLGVGERALAAGLLGGGAAILLALAGAIAPGVRGFGAIFAWSLITLAAALLSLVAPPLSLAQPIAWAVLVTAGYAALRASGVAAQAAPPLGPLFGLLAAVLLAGGLLATGEQLASATLPAWPAALCGLLAALGMAGAPPLAGARAEAIEAPAPLSALVYGLAAPAAALSWLLRVMAELPIVPTGWSVALGLIGGLGVLACAAGALGVRSLRALLTWITAGQAAAVIAAAGLAGPLAAVAGPSLLLALMLAAALGAVAAATFERTTGSDDYTIVGPNPPALAGIVWAIAGAAALGLPPLWGFWPKLWLYQAAYEQQPWLLAPLLAGAALTGLALLAPLARLWGAGTAAGARWADAVPAALIGLPLLALGVAPGLAWQAWLQATAFAPPTIPTSRETELAAIGAGALLIALTAGVARLQPARSLARDPDEEEVRLAPDALGAALQPLAWLGNPAPLLRWVWAGLQRASEGLRFVMGVFEQRYYLLGMLAALLVIMLLMAQ